MPLFSCLLLLLFPYSLVESSRSVSYDISFPNYAHHEAVVRISFSGVSDKPLAVVMSRSSPGRYALHEFAKNISNFEAKDSDGRLLQITHADPYSWIVIPRGESVICTYVLYGDRADGTYAAIDASHAHLNIPATLAWARGWEDVPSKLTFQIPPGLNWKAQTELLPNSDGSFSAANLQMLMDGPVELSASPRYDWTMDGATFRLALHQQGSESDARTFEQMCQRVVAEEKAVFGSLPKYDGGTYTFLIDYLPYVNGDGMEHRDSTVITSAINLHDAMKRAIGTVAHEFFHCWNVRRIRPRSLEPFDFERANMSSELWFAEGFTNYYGELALERAGLSTFEDFLNGMGHAVNVVLNDPGRNVYFAAQMSEQAPFVDAARSIDPTNGANNLISYYTYGQALAFGIDLAIRERFPGKSLDDWMRTMWHEHPDVDKPYDEADLRHALAETVGSEKFADDLFANNILGMQALNYGELLAPAGLLLAQAHPGQVWLGASHLTATATGIEIDGPTLRSSPLYLAGLDRGDEIQECNGDNLKALSRLDNCISSRRVGEVVTLKIKGRTGTKLVAVKLDQDPTLLITTFEKSARPVNTAIQAFRSQWLTSQIQQTKP